MMLVGIVSNSVEEGKWKGVFGIGEIESWR